MPSTSVIYDLWEESVYFHRNFPTVTRWLFGYQFEQRLRDKVKPHGLLETVMVIFSSSYAYFLPNRHCYSLPEAIYEKLVSKPEETFNAVFDICGISKSLIADAVTALNLDSQAGNIFRRDKMAQKSLELTTTDRGRSNEIVKIL